MQDIFKMAQAWQERCREQAERDDVGGIYTEMANEGERVLKRYIDAQLAENELACLDNVTRGNTNANVVGMVRKVKAQNA